MAIETEWEDRVTQARRERQVNADAAARRLADAITAADRSIRWLAAYRRQPVWRRLGAWCLLEILTVSDNARAA